VIQLQDVILARIVVWKVC